MNKQKAKAIAAEVAYKNRKEPGELADDDYFVLLVERLFSDRTREVADRLFTDSDEIIGKSFRPVP